MITPRRIRIIAPIRIAITDVSPMVPGIFPVSISMTLTEESPSFLIMASGVAPEYASNLELLKFVMSAAKAISRKHLPPSAGFMKFCPSPPNIIFTMTMANTLPITASHHGSPAGRFSARRSPVTTALRSGRLFFLCTILSKIHSEARQLAMVTKIKSNACIPKFQIPNRVAGSNAMITYSITLLVESLARTCGEDET